MFARFDPMYADFDRAMSERPACDLQHTRRFERRLAEDFGEPADALRPRLVAAAAVAALRASSDRADRILEEDAEAAEVMVADPLAFIDHALRFLEGGLAALRH